MAFGTRIRFDQVRELPFTSVLATYTPIGTPLTDHARLIMFNNGLDQSVYISFDGSTNHLRLAPNSFQLFDLSANKIRDDGLFMAAGTQIYCKEVSATVLSGTLWIEVMYGEGGK
jgi:hypothetical protein